MPKSLESKRKQIIILLILLIASQITFVSVVSKEINLGGQVLSTAFTDVEDLRESQYVWIIRVQSNDLVYIRNIYDTIFKGNYPLVEPEHSFHVFIQGVIKTRLGMDGEGIVAVFNESKDLLFACDRASNALDELLPYVEAKDKLSPEHFMTGDNPDDFPFPSIRYDRIFWNRIVINSAEDKEEKLIVFIGFRERILLYESGTAFAKARENIYSFGDIVSRMFIKSGLTLVFIFVIGFSLSFKIKEVNSLKADTRGRGGGNVE